MQLWYLLTLVEISHTLHSAGPPGSSITTVPLWQFPLVYASLFSRLCVFPSHPLSGSMRSSLSQLLSDLNHIAVRAPGAEQTDIPPFCSDRQREWGKKRKRRMRERKDCVSVSSLSTPPGKMQIPLTLSWNAVFFFSFLLMRKLHWVQMGPGRNNTGENLRRITFCLRILTPADGFKPKWAFP